MPESLAALEQQRSNLMAEFARLNDLRPGSVTGIVRRCGKPTCHCAQPEDTGHGPTLRLTCKVQGKTISEALPTQAAYEKPGRRSASSVSIGNWVVVLWRLTKRSAVCGR